MNRTRFFGGVSAIILCISSSTFLYADPPYVIPEWAWTTDQNGQLFNTISWNPTGADHYRVRCLLANENQGVAFPEPFYTRGGTNVLYVSRSDLIAWTDVWGTTYDFYYPGPSFPFHEVMHGLSIRYQVNSFPDAFDIYGETSSVQDNQGPWILPESFMFPDVNAGSSGDQSGTVKMVDYPAGVLRGSIIAFYGSHGQSGEIAMAFLGDDTYSFTVPEPAGGWGIMAGENLTVRVHGYDNAALPDEYQPSWWFNESYTDFVEPVEGAGASSMPPVVLTRVAARDSSNTGRNPGERSTTFTLQWATNPSFSPLAGETEVTGEQTYTMMTASWLNDDTQYWFRVMYEDQFGQSEWSAPVTSVADHQLPILDNWNTIDLTEATEGPWTGTIEVDDIELNYPGGGSAVAGILDYRIGSGGTQSVGLSVFGDPPGNPSNYSFSVPEPAEGWESFAGQTINNMVVRVWDSAAPPTGLGPNIEDNTTYFYPPDELIEAVKPAIELLAPQQGDVLEDEVWVTWIATDDQVPGGADPDGDETEDLVIDLSYSRGFTPWTLISEEQNSATQPDSALWDLNGLPEADDYRLRAIARDPAGHADTAIVAPLTVNVADPPEITVVAPNGGEVILGQYTIQWEASDADSSYGQPPLSLRIDGWYSSDAGNQWDTLPMASHLNDGEEDWNTSTLPDGDQYLLRLRATDPTNLWSEDESDDLFTIDNNDPPDSVHLIAPNGGEVWYDQHLVQWYAHDPDVLDTLLIKLDYRRYNPEDPLFFNNLLDLENTGQYLLNVDSLLTHYVFFEDWYELRVRAYDTGGLSGADTCDAPFLVNRPDDPTVDVLAPNGGEFWSGTQSIQWSADDADIEFGDTLSITIEASTDNGGSWTTQAAGLANTGSYEWDTTVFPDGADNLIRICATDTFVGTTICDVSDETFYILNEDQPPSVEVLYPNGGESVRDSVLVQWLATDPDFENGDTVAIAVSFSADSGYSWTPLVEGLPNTGSWLWNINTLPDGNQYLVEVCATDRQLVTVCDRSDSTFSVFNDPDNPAVTVISPNGGEHWSGVQTVEWAATDPDLEFGDTLAATVWVDSSSQAGFQPLLIAEGIPGLPGEYIWNTADFGLPDGDWYRIRVRVTDTDGLSATDESDGTFLLFNNNDPPTISILAPTEGDIWKETQTIRWFAGDPDIEWGDTVAVSLYIRGSPDEQWIAIVLGLANTGSRDWDTQTVPDGLEYQIRAVARDTSLATGEDVSGVFAIENVNEAPDEFNLISPENGGTVTVFKPLMIWETARDIDAGDRVEYELAYTLEDASEERAWAGSDTMLTDQDWPEPLVDDSRYEWYVEATDSLGPETTRSSETWWFVTNVDGNDQPQSFNLVAPDSGILVEPDSVFFSWTPSFDEDVLDTVRYTIYFDTLSTMTTPTTVSVGTVTSWRASFSLLDNTTYYWAVLARDVNGAERWSEELWPFTTDRNNDAPDPFHLLSPLPGTVYTASEQDTLHLRWEAAPDPDPLDRVVYTAVVTDSVHPVEPDWPGETYVYSVGDSTSFGLSAIMGSAFEDNRIYTWHIYAIDSRGDTTRSNEQWWFATNNRNEAPLVFDLLSPCNGCTLSTLVPELSWEAALDPDPLDRLTYRIDHDVDADFPTVRSDSGLPEPNWRPADPFSDRGSVYWRVYAKDQEGRSTRCQPEWWEFIILPQHLLEGLINYPNPFAAGNEHTTIQYVLMFDARVEMKIFDLLGNPVWSHSFSPGENGGRMGTNMVDWDGENDKGQVVGNGGYLCLVKVRPPGGEGVEKTRKIAVMK